MLLYYYFAASRPPNPTFIIVSELAAVIDFALAPENDRLIENMVAAANARARIVFSLDFVGCYYHALFTEYSRSLAFPVTVPPGAILMRNASSADLDALIAQAYYL